MKNFLKIIHVLITGILLLILLYFVYKPTDLLSLRSEAKELMNPYSIPKVVEDIMVDLNKASYANQTELLDGIRNYVYNNSCHKENTEYHLEVALKLDKRFTVLEDIYKFHHGDEFRPELSCTPRTWAMQEIVRAYDIPFRIINIYFTERPKGTLTSHTFLEVYNADSQNWEIQDPDSNIYYIDSVGDRLSSMDLMSTSDKSQISACKSFGNCEEDYKYWFSFRQSFKAIRIGYLGSSMDKKDLFIIDDDYYNLEESLENPKSKLLDIFNNSQNIVY